LWKTHDMDMLYAMMVPCTSNVIGWEMISTIWLVEQIFSILYNVPWFHTQNNKYKLKYIEHHSTDSWHWPRRLHLPALTDIEIFVWIVIYPHWILNTCRSS
jgi:hypothetical protein